MRTFQFYILQYFKSGPIKFEEADLSVLPPPSNTPDAEKKDIPTLEKPKKEITGKIII